MLAVSETATSDRRRNWRRFDYSNLSFSDPRSRIIRFGSSGGGDTAPFMWKEFFSVLTANAVLSQIKVAPVGVTGAG